MADGPRYCSWSPEKLLRDPRVRLLEAEPFGAFTSILVELFLSEEASLPDDDETLALCSRLGKKWPKYEKRLRALFVMEAGRVTHPIVDEALLLIATRSKNAKLAVSARIAKIKLAKDQQERDEKSKKVEPVNESTDEQSIIQGEGKRKGKGEGKDTYSQKEINLLFEEFASSWKALGSTRPFNRAEALKSYQKASQRAPLDQINKAVKVYGDFIKARLVTKPDMKEFIPLASTWLNQSSWTTEYPQATIRKIKGEPTQGIDFYWDSIESIGEDGKPRTVTGQFKIKNGEKTQIPFRASEWREENE